MSASKAPALAGRTLMLPRTLHLPAHVVQFYQEDDALIEELAHLIGTSLVSGDAAVVIATRKHRDALARALAARDLNVAKATADGRYIALDAAETLSQILTGQMPDAQRFEELVGGTIEKAKASAKTDSPCTLIFGEMVALLWQSEKYEAALRLEELWNGLAEKHTFLLRCGYPMNEFQSDTHGELFVKVCAQHTAVVPLGNRAGPISEDERLRTIAQLQQKLEVLEYSKALNASEQRFRLLVEAVQDYAIFMLDHEGRVITWNLGAERLKGYKAAEIMGQHFSRFYPEEDIRGAKPQRELEIANSEGRVEDEGWRVRKDGSKFWANVVITALKDVDGRIIGYAKVTRDFTERVQAEMSLRESQRQLQNSEASLRQLSHHLLRTQDAERRRIGRDLHDSLGQYLSVLKMKLDALRSAASLKGAGDIADLADCAQLTEDAVKEVRTISYLLYPPMLEEMGLKSAISWYLDGFGKRSEIKTTFESSPDFGRLPPDIELAFFRVLQESLTNVHRHSGSQTATVRLSRDEEAVVLEVADQGKGSQQENSPEEAARDWTESFGVGLRGMSERVRQMGGKLELSSGRNGTTVRAIVPIEKATEATAG